MSIPEEPLLAPRVEQDWMDETTRIAAAVDGDPRAREWLVRRWTPSLHRFSRRMVGNDEDAADVAQDAMVKILRNLHRYDRKRSFSTWSYGITRNTCIDLLRRRRHRTHEQARETASGAPSPLQEVSRGQRAELLHTALEQLPPMYREVLVLYHFEHLKYVEIAEALELPMGTVMNRIFRARRKLREAYEPLAGGIA